MKSSFISMPLLAIALVAAAPASSPTPSAGGAFQRSSVEGCVGDQLFDGVWRVKVIAVDPAAAYNDGSAETGVGIKLQVRNGTAKELAPDESGFSDINGRGIDLAFDDENTTSAVGAGTDLTVDLMDKKLPPGGAATVTVYFPYGPDKNAKPSKLLIAVDPSAKTNYAHVKYSAKSPSFRIHLDCPAAAGQ